MTITGGCAMTDTPEPPMARTLADLRRTAGLRQRDVAARMGVSPARVAQIEKDFPNLSYPVVNAYAEALGGQLALTGVETQAVAFLADPRDPGAQANRKQRSISGVERLRQSAASAKELKLEQSNTDPGSDPSGGQIDHPDPECHQGDRPDSHQS